MRIIITSPSANITNNVSGVSAITNFIVRHNTVCSYEQFVLGKRDGEARTWRWLLRTLAASVRWVYVMALREKRAVVHFNLALDKRALLRDSPLILVARLFRRRIVVHIHGGEFITGVGIPSWLESVIALTLAHVPIIVLSQKEKAMLEKRVRNAQIFVLPNCVGVEEATSFQRSYVDDEPLTILFLGRIALSKGIDLIYLSLEILKEAEVNFRFVIAGSGPAEEYYIPKFRKLLGPKFEFSGVVAGAAKTELLKKCDVFLLPSRFEGLPMALLESMAFGLVAITTDVGSISTVLKDGDNGVLVDARPSAIVAALKRLSTDRSYMQALSENARRHILHNLRPETYVTRLNEIYEHE
jgi:glycosyltransferase involved in cell wall biosynthesis